MIFSTIIKVTAGREKLVSPISTLQSLQQKKTYTMRERAKTFSYLSIDEEDVVESLTLCADYRLKRNRSNTISTTLSVEPAERKKSAVNTIYNSNSNSGKCYRPRTQTNEICRTFSLSCIAETFIETYKNHLTNNCHITKSERRMMDSLHQQSDIKLEFPEYFHEKEVLSFLKSRHKRRFAVQYSKKSKEARQILKFCMQYKHLNELWNF